MSDNVSLLDSGPRQPPRGPYQSNIPTGLKPRRIIFEMAVFNFVCGYKFGLQSGYNLLILYSSTCHGTPLGILRAAEQ